MVLAFLAATVAVLDGRHSEQLKAERDAAAAAPEVVTVVSDAIRTRMERAALAGSPEERVLTLAAAAADGISVSALTLARDTGEPVLDDAAAGVVVVARYNAGAGASTVQDRRNQVAGYTILPLDLGGTLKPLIPEEGGIAVSGPDRRILSTPPGGPRSAARITASLGPDLTSGWSATVWTRPTRTPTTAWLVVTLILVTGLAVAGWVGARQAESRRRRDELSGLQTTSATVVELATLAQYSLDLGEVLPAVTTELSAALGLRGLSVSAPTPQGERPIFVMGVPPDPGTAPQGQHELAAGQTLTVVLSRGGRIVATLRVTAGRDLSRHDVRTIYAAGDVLTSALTNAEVFSQQADLIARMRTVDELKSVFLATASHELRTPVVTLAGYANLLHANWDQLAAEEARNYAGRVDSIAQRLSKLVEDILDFSRLQSGNALGAGLVALDLAETVGRILEEQPDIAPDYRLDYQLSPGLQVSGSEQAVERVLTNLIGNAAKYSDPGTTILILTREADGRAELVVSDEGPGIPVDQRAQVFSPFYRGSGDEVVRTRGAGLGLAIVTEFAASMGGQVRVEEADGGGASFVVSYPVVVSESVLDPGAAHVQA